MNTVLMNITGTMYRQQITKDMPRKKKEDPIDSPEAKEELEWVKKLWDLKNGIRTERIDSLEEILD